MIRKSSVWSTTVDGTTLGIPTGSHKPGLLSWYTNGKRWNPYDMGVPAQHYTESWPMQHRAYFEWFMMIDITTVCLAELWTYISGANARISENKTHNNRHINLVGGHNPSEKWLSRSSSRDMIQFETSKYTAMVGTCEQLAARDTPPTAPPLPTPTPLQAVLRMTVIPEVQGMVSE